MPKRARGPSFHGQGKKKRKRPKERLLKAERKNLVKEQESNAEESRSRAEAEDFHVGETDDSDGSEEQVDESELSEGDEQVEKQPIDSLLDMLGGPLATGTKDLEGVNEVKGDPIGGAEDEQANVEDLESENSQLSEVEPDEVEAEKIIEGQVEGQEILKVVKMEHELFSQPADLETGKSPRVKKASKEPFLKCSNRLEMQWTKGVESSKKPSGTSAFKDIRQLGVPLRMVSRFAHLNGSDQLSEMAGVFCSAIASYRDVFWAASSTPAQKKEILNSYVAWGLSHVLRARARVNRHSALRAKKEKQKLTEGKDSIEDVAEAHVKEGDVPAPNAAEKQYGGNFDPEACRDQGYTRARLLILLPVRAHAYKVVSALCGMCITQTEDSEKAQIMNKKKFETAYGMLEGVDPMHTEREKPKDYQELFSGNVDDDFVQGIKVGRKTMQLHCSVYTSDIIVASPLGLRKLIEAEILEAGDSAPEQVVRSASDFLSSIEMLIMDGLRFMSMQNWEHVKFVSEKLNCMPGKIRETDFSRVRPYFLEGLMKSFRQSIIVSEYVTPRVSAFFRACSNHTGKYLIRESHRTPASSKILLRTRQVYNLVPSVLSPSDVADRRFNFFKETVLPQLRDSISARVLIFVPDYFDYVRLRNYFFQLRKETARLRFASISEYNKGPEITRARARFYNGHVDYLIITERFHFFYRYQLRGAKTIVFYRLPENSHFYPELINMIENDGNKAGSVLTLYDRYDFHAVERVVGEKHAKAMTTSTDKSVYLLY